MAMALGKVASSSSPNRVRGNAYAKSGADIALREPIIMAARNLSTLPEYLYGFDIGVAVSTPVDHNPEGGMPDATKDPLGRAEFDSVRNSLYPLQGLVGTLDGVKGFDVGVATHTGLLKAKKEMGPMPTNPNVAMGVAVTNGLSGSDMTSNQKATVMRQVITDPLAKAGASAAIEEKKGFFKKVLEFFGLG